MQKGRDTARQEAEQKESTSIFKLDFLFFANNH